MFAPAAIAFFLATAWLPTPWDLALTVLTLGAAVVVAMAPEASGTPWPWPDALVLFPALGFLVSVFTSDHAVLGLLLGSSFVPALLLYLLLSRFIGSTDQLRLVVAGLALGAGLLAVSVLIGAWLHPGDSTALVKALGLPLLVVPNDALLLAVSGPLIAAGALVAPSRPQAGLFALAVALCFAAILVLDSRSALVAGVLGVGLVLLLRGGPWALRALFGGALGLLGLDGARGFPLLQKFARAPLCDPRLPLWDAALRLWWERPLLGHGAFTFRDLYRDRLDLAAVPACAVADPRLTPWPHNLPLELLSSQGLLGGLAFVALVAWAWHRALRLSRHPHRVARLLAAGTLGALAAFSFAALVELSLVRYWVVTYAAILIGLLVALSACPTSPAGANP